MSAPVRIEAAAFSDQRYELLGQLAGYDRFAALGRMAYLWSACTDRGVDHVSEAIVRACLGPAGVEAILGAELGERAEEGGIRVKGASEDRIGWYVEGARTRRALAQRAGQARAASAQRDQHGRMIAQPATSGPPADHQRKVQRPTSADQPQPAPLSLSQEEKNTDPPPLASLGEPPRRPGPRRRVQLPADWEPNCDHDRLAAGIGVPTVTEAAKFRDWAIAKGEVKADWDAAFRNWLRRAAEPRGSPGRPAAPTAKEKWAEADRLESEGR